MYKNILFTIILVAFFNVESHTQNISVLNGYKAVDVSCNFEDKYGLVKEANRVFQAKGMQSSENNLTLSGCNIATIIFSVIQVPNSWNCGKLGIKIQNCNGDIIYNSTMKTPNVMSSPPYYTNCFSNWYKSISRHTTNFTYKYDESLKVENKKSTVIEFEDSRNSVDLSSEISLREYFDKYAVDMEGIWEFAGDNNKYRLAFIKDDIKYNATVITKKALFYPGDVKATLETASSEKLLTINWKMGDKSTNIQTIGILEDDKIIEFTLQNEKRFLYKVYPKSKTRKRSANGDWYGNGSGIVISKNGYIITNNHVIEDANEIEVELLSDGEVQKYNAEVVQVDKTNDLVILKILDINFDGLNQISYNFKSRSSDVGTKVYAFGYPMALTIMGKEIKVTDGIISSKTGFDGDITTYQITAPIQEGNSGGPLFDDKGNLIGINSSGLRKDVADNVGYSIKTNYVLNLIDILPKSIDLPSNTKLSSLPLTEQIKEISKYVVLIKVK